jgi:type II secretory ATPase GspE/PulE/Tfp pilus assembly ATPase PilB-like protein
VPHFHADSGCNHCGDAGFSERVGIHRRMAGSRGLRRLAQERARSEQVHEPRRAAGRHEKVLVRLTTLDKVRATSNV